MDYKAKLELPKRSLAIINGYLNAKRRSEFQDEDEVICHSVTFPDGKVMDIKCCGCQDDSSWTEAVLFTPCNGGLYESGFTDVESEYLGVWTLEDGGNTYTVIVEEGRAEVSGPTLTPLSPADAEGWNAD